MRSLRIAAWRLALGLVTGLAWVTARRRRPAALLPLLLLPLAVTPLRRCSTPPLRIATFNIENYGRREVPTDEDRLRALLADTDADVIAVQEIEDPGRFAQLVAEQRLAGRRYRFVSSRCGGGERVMRVGFVIDEGRVRLIGTEEYPDLEPIDDEACRLQERPGLLGRFEAGGRRFDLLVVHLMAMPERRAERLVRWDRAIAIAASWRARGEPVAILGDVNSTGYLRDEGGERSAIEARLGAAGLRLATADLACTEYYKPRGATHLEASVLDHVALPADFPIPSVARVRGYCADVSCSPRLATAPRDFALVSDHCPVVVGPP